jgi:hypothetical protein
MQLMTFRPTLPQISRPEIPSTLMNMTQMEMLVRLEDDFLEESLDLLEDIFGDEDLVVDDRDLEEHQGLAAIIDNQ